VVIIFLYNFRYKFRRKKYFSGTFILLEALYRRGIHAEQRNDVLVIYVSEGQKREAPPHPQR
jgi:hypothetical protein